MLDAFLILDKPLGLSSQQAVSKVRRALGLRKAGHTGTLDPLATGVLPIGFGEATKVIPFLDESEKIYWVEAKLGESTATDDAEGEILQSRPVPPLGHPDLETALQRFLGEQEQRPPRYSAIKVKGQALYRAARAGQACEAPLRTVKIFAVKILEWNSPQLRFRVHCGRGTYVRSLVRDLGEALGCGAHVTALRRERSGPFLLERALTLEQVLASPQAVPPAFFSIEDCLGHLPRIDLVSREEQERTHQGQVLARVAGEFPSDSPPDAHRVLTFLGQAVAVVKSGGNGYQFLRVLHRAWNENK